MTKARPRIITNPDLMVGKPTIEGTRITVEFILEEMTGGRTIDQLIDAYSLSREEIEAALGYAVKAVRAQQKKRSASLQEDEREWEAIVHTPESQDFLAYLREETLADIDAGDIEDGGFGQG